MPMNAKPYKRLTFWQIEQRLMVPAVIIGILAPLIEGSFTAGSVARVMAVTVCTAVLVGVVYRWLIMDKAK